MYTRVPKALVNVCIFTSRISSPGNRIGPVCVLVTTLMAELFEICMCASIHHNMYKRTFGHKDCTLGEAGGT